MPIPNKPFYALVWILVFQFIGFGLGSITSSNMDWYHTIIKSSLTPPNVVFPIVNNTRPMFISNQSNYKKARLIQCFGWDFKKKSIIPK